jgi:hypothetical protein
MQKVIGLMGVKGSGKDTAAAHLVEMHGFSRVGFADALYQEAADAFGVAVDRLSNRATKESPSLDFALQNCKDPHYVGCVLGHEGVLNLDEMGDSLVRAQPRSPRVILQHWGTEYRRKGFPGVYEGKDSYWIDLVRAVIAESPEVNFAITDVRFLNEYRYVRSVGGVLARVRRPELEAREALERAKSGAAAHSSETELLGVPVDLELLNTEGDHDSLKAAVLALSTSLDSPQLA